MTKEELAKEAEMFVSEKADKGNFDLEQFGKAYFSESSMKQAYIDSAEPREKRIAELEDCIKDLQKDCENKTNVIADYTNKLAICNTKIAELETQIKTMKCCQNCMHYRHFTKDITECAMSFVSAQNCRHNGFDKWEIRK